jgi:hypothetical protein
MTSQTAVATWFCGVGPDTPCTAKGQHFDRYLRTWQEGLISRKTVTYLCLVLGPVSAAGKAISPLWVLSRPQAVFVRA